MPAPFVRAFELMPLTNTPAEVSPPVKSRLVEVALLGKSHPHKKDITAVEVFHERGGNAEILVVPKVEEGNPKLVSKQRRFPQGQMSLLAASSSRPK